MKKIHFLVFILALVWAAPASAYKLETSEHTFLNINFLLQFQGQLIEKGAPDKTSWGKDAFARRARLILSGSIMKNISFFFDTDMPNWGKGNDWSTPAFIIQDAFMTFKIVDQFMIDAGIIIPPFSRHGYQSAVSTLGLDYHSGVIKYPEGSNNVWRDAGAQLRGYIFDSRFQYRLAVLNGSKNDALQKDVNKAAVVLSNPKDYPRVTAHVRYNILGKETDPFAKGIYFADKAIVSLGASFDYQQDAGLHRAATFIKDASGNDTAKVDMAGELANYMAVSADVFAEVPFLGGDHEMIMQASYYKYWHGLASKFSGHGVFGEIGYRYKAFSPVFGFDYFNSDLAKQDLMVIHAGAVYWIMKHNVNLKFDAAIKKDGDLSVAPFVTTMTLQAQIYF
jgi:hypothetical protein